jgi:hypothetical protein
MASGVKLDDKVVQDIARLIQAGETSGRKIAKALGLPKSTVQPYMKQLQAGAAPMAAPAGEAAPPAPASRTSERAHHPLAELFPLMAEPDFAALKADISTHGLREPIWLWQGKILDGRNRHRACLELGIACPTREYRGQDPLGFILSMNLHRRHLNESQRAMVAAKMARLPQGVRADRAANLPVVITQADAAAQLHVSERSVRDAHKVRTEAQPEVIRAVEAGTMAVSAAAKLAEKPVDVQRTVVKELESGTAKTVTAALKQITTGSNGQAPAPATQLTRAEAEFDRRLAQTCQYFATVEGATLVEGLGQRFAEEDIKRWEQALTRLGAITKQLAARLLQACRERQ